MGSFQIGATGAAACKGNGAMLIAVAAAPEAKCGLFTAKIDRLSSIWVKTSNGRRLSITTCERMNDLLQQGISPPGDVS
jgi:hypothetical protein